MSSCGCSSSCGCDSADELRPPKGGLEQVGRGCGSGGTRGAVTDPANQSLGRLSNFEESSGSRAAPGGLSREFGARRKRGSSARGTERLGREQRPTVAGGRLPATEFGSPLKLIGQTSTVRGGGACGNGQPNDVVLRASGNIVPEATMGQVEQLLPAVALSGVDGPNLGAVLWKDVRASWLRRGTALRLPREGQEGALFAGRQPAERSKFHPEMEMLFAPLDIDVFTSSTPIFYRTVRLEIDWDFLLPYWGDLIELDSAYQDERNLGNDTKVGWVATVNETIEEFWDGILDTKGDPQTFHELIGCYNLPTGEQDFLDQYAFWPIGWGAPHKVHLWTCQMLYNFALYVDYWPSIENIPTEAQECVGMGAFLKKLFEGKNADNRNGDPCFLTVSYRTDGSDSNKLHDWCATQGDIPVRCGSTFAEDKDSPEMPCVGVPWGDWTLSWIKGTNCYTGDGLTTGCNRPNARCWASARHHNWSLHFHASELAFDGAVCDHVMYLTRMLWDYSRWLHREGRVVDSAAAYEAASQMSRYALTIMLYRAEHFIHELGHAWLQDSTKTNDYDGGHCAYNCCNDISGTHFFCWVRARLGLPYLQYEGNESDDFDPTDRAQTAEYDSCSTDVGAVHYWTCDIGENGVIGNSPRYCSTGCLLRVREEVEGGNLSPSQFYDFVTDTTYEGTHDFCADDL